MFTLPHTLDRAKTLFPDAGISDGNRHQTYHETAENAAQLATELRNRGVSEGSVVSVAAWNTPRFFELLYAITGIGAVIYPVNVNLPPEQIAYTIERSDADMLLYDSDFDGLAESFEGDAISIPALEYAEEATELSAAQDDPAVILFTSGTTGMPKAVRYTHAQIVHSSLGMAHQMAEYQTPAALSGGDTVFPGIPMYHLLAWGTTIFAPYLGADLMLAGRFDPQRLGAAAESGEATWSCLVPTMAVQVLETGHDLSGLTLLTGGSVVKRGLTERLRDAGVSFATIYGGTDMLAVGITLWTKHARREGYEYVRRSTHPIPAVEVKIDERAGQDGMGELLVRSPWLPDGYYDAPEGKDDAYVDGWFRTGDLGRRLPDGGITILDRLTDAIKSGGEWIPSGVLESVISETDGVENVAVLAKSDAEWGERPVAVISGDVTAETLQADLRSKSRDGRIESWWIPDDVRFVEEMPLTSTGKIQKTSLRDQIRLE
ncbi:AMP-dependent synthetase [Halogeometricum borinquense]|uniref:AMP-dependent synthetase n=1 Tax=Halogeometricum borinquense TaxID=60847 RepID=A0A482T7F0_9EURY|nr:AMP-binding protein [Halogeometricum borinquense]RYJ08545.1 AMP-dependent synthetase [Halogeometricum borinquense]